MVNDIMDWESSSDKEMMCKYLKERYKILKRSYYKEQEWFNTHPKNEELIKEHFLSQQSSRSSWFSIELMLFDMDSISVLENIDDEIRDELLTMGYSVSLKNLPKEMITNIKEIV